MGMRKENQTTTTTKFFKLWYSQNLLA